VYEVCYLWLLKCGLWSAVNNDRTKHIDIRVHFIREKVESKELSKHYIPGNSFCFLYTNEELAIMHYMYGLADSNALEARRLYRYDTPRVDCQTERHLKESITAYANMGVLHVHQAPGNGQEVQTPRRRKMISTL
jgi:hypothetical protein